MANVISADYISDKHYRHNGFSATITDSYASPDAGPQGITWDGTNVISADYISDKHYRHNGFSATITDSYSSPALYPTGITWDGTNVISADMGVDKHYKHSGFSATITSSYTSPSTSPRDITWDGTNVISADSIADKHYKHSGFSATITDSYASPDAGPQGITWDSSNVISADLGVDKHYKHSGFSATITDSYSSPDAGPQGITWDVTTGATYNVALSLSHVLTITPNEIQLNTTYTTIPIVRKRIKYIDANLTDTNIEQFIVEAEGIIDAIMTDSLKDIFDASKHDCIRACASDLAGLMCITYDPSNYPTIEAADMAADLLNNALQSSLMMIDNPRNVKYWKSL